MVCFLLYFEGKQMIVIRAKWADPLPERGAVWDLTERLGFKFVLKRTKLTEIVF
jgi:hypothetical protein